jgi:hypothetical protein
MTTFGSNFPPRAFPADCDPDYFDGIDVDQAALTAAYSELQTCDGFRCWATIMRDEARTIYCDAKLLSLRAEISAQEDNTLGDSDFIEWYDFLLAEDMDANADKSSFNAFVQYLKDNFGLNGNNGDFGTPDVQ